MRSMTSALSLAIASGMAPRAWATPDGTAQNAVEYVVGGASSSGFEVPVSKDLVTVFHFPEPVLQAFTSSQRDLQVSFMSDTVAVHPLREPLTANLNVNTKSLHISILMKTVPVDQAKTQVVFTSAQVKADEERRKEAEVERRMAPLKAEIEESRRTIEEQVRARTQAALAEGMARQFQAQALGAIARTPAGVIVRVDRAIRVGDEVYLRFQIQNRSETPFVVGAARFYQGTSELPRSAVTFLPHAGTGSTLGTVGAGHQGVGVYVVPASALGPGALELRVTEGASGQVVTVGDVRVNR